MAYSVTRQIDSSLSDEAAPSSAEIADWRIFTESCANQIGISDQLLNVPVEVTV